MPLDQVIDAIVLSPQDNVAVLKRPVRRGEAIQLNSRQLLAREKIPAGHKVALQDIAADAAVTKYGQFIGQAIKDIAAGEHVHTHNLGLNANGRSSGPIQSAATAPLSTEPMRFFEGYARPRGRVGTRNYLAVISSVNCSASVARYVAEHFKTDQLRQDYPSIDGVIAFNHKTGCGIDPGGPQQVLQRVLAGIARHPNIGGYLMVGLGCEVNQLDALRRAQNLDQLQPEEVAPTFLTIQNLGGIRKTVEAAVSAVRAMLPAANAVRRTRQPASKLVLAENCGGSDALSGITANPALGVASDRLVGLGGTSVLAETPEIYGAEHLLVNRAASPEVAEKLMSFIHWWEEHARLHNCTIDNNPAPGNKEGGLTNIFEKSLGAVAKGGQAPLMAVYDYAEQVDKPGFCFMNTPGFDPVSMTGLVAGGCNVAVFTTGRGSVYGAKPTPCIKVSSNTHLYNWMSDDIDLNAGTIVDGTETLEQVGTRIFEKIIAVASGEKTKSELAGIGDEEFAPWQLGPTF